MPLMNIAPTLSPKAFYDARKAQESQQQESFKLSKIPDGTGLQILFRTPDHFDPEYYVLVGPRGGEVMSVNGGSIEDINAPFLTQLAEELDEETFGVLKIEQDNGVIYLNLDGRKYPLNFNTESSFIKQKEGVYGYVTFTAICDVDDFVLERAATKMTPTAKFWSTIGNELFKHQKVVAKMNDEEFLGYWNSEKLKSERDIFIANLFDECEKLGPNLLIQPKDGFKAKDDVSVLDNQEALNKLHAIKSAAEFSNLFKKVVGRYSERTSYHVINAKDMLVSAKAQQMNMNGTLCDINGQSLGDKLFNPEPVSEVFPKVNDVLNARAQVGIEIMKRSQAAASAGFFAKRPGDDGVLPAPKARAPM